MADTNTVTSTQLTDSTTTAETTTTAADATAVTSDGQSGFCSADERISTHTCNSLHPAIAMDSYGNRGVVWYDNRDGDFEIYLKFLPTLISTESQALALTSFYTPEEGRVANFSCSGFSGFSGFSGTSLTSKDVALLTGRCAAADSTDNALVRLADGKLDVNQQLSLAYVTGGQGTDFFTLGVNPGATLLIETGLNANKSVLVISAVSSKTLRVSFDPTLRSDFGFVYALTSNPLFKLQTCELRLTCEKGASLFPDIVADRKCRWHVVFQDDKSGNNEIYYIQIGPPEKILKTCPPNSPGISKTNGFSNIPSYVPKSTYTFRIDSKTKKYYKKTGKEGDFFAYGNRSVPPLTGTGQHVLFRDWYGNNGKWIGLSRKEDFASWQTQSAAIGNVPSPVFFEYQTPFTQGGEFGSVYDFSHLVFQLQAPPDIGIDLRTLVLPLYPKCTPSADIKTLSNPSSQNLIEAPKKPLPPTFVDPVDISSLLTSPYVTFSSGPSRFTLEGDDTGTVYTNVLLENSSGELSRLLFKKNIDGNLIKFILGATKCGDTNCAVKTSSSSKSIEVTKDNRSSLRIQIWLGPDYRIDDGLIDSVSTTSEKMLLDKVYYFDTGENFTTFVFEPNEVLVPRGSILYCAVIPTENSDYAVVAKGSGTTIWTAENTSGNFNQYNTPYTLPPYQGLNASVYYDGYLLPIENESEAIIKAKLPPPQPPNPNCKSQWYGGYNFAGRGYKTACPYYGGGVSPEAANPLIMPWPNYPKPGRWVYISNSLKEMQEFWDYFAAIATHEEPPMGSPYTVPWNGGAPQPWRPNKFYGSPEPDANGNVYYYTPLFRLNINGQPSVYGAGYVSQGEEEEPEDPDSDTNGDKPEAEICNDVEKFLFTPPLRLTNSIGKRSEYPRLAISTNNNIWLTFHSDRDGNNDIYVSRFSSICDVWNASATGGEDIRVSYFSTQNRRAMFPKIAIGSNGIVHIAFQGLDEDGKWQIFYSHSTGGGTNFAVPIQITKSRTGALMPDVEVSYESGQEVITIVWHDNRTGLYQLFAAQKKQGAWRSSYQDGADIRVTNSTSNDMFARIKADPSGNLRVVFQSDRSGTQEIYLATYLASAQTWSSTGTGQTDLKVSTGPRNSLFPDLDLDQQGGVAAVWHDDRHITENPDLHEEIYGNYCVSLSHVSGVHFPPLITNDEVFLDREFSFVDCVGFEAVSLTTTPEVCLKIRAPGATFWRAANAGESFSDWQTFKPNQDLETMTVPWKLTCGNGTKEVCVQVQNHDSVGFPLCKTISLVSPPIDFDVQLYEDENFTLPLPYYQNRPAIKAGDIWLKITSPQPVLLPPTFDVVHQGYRIITNQKTEAVSGFSGEAGIGSFIGQNFNGTFSSVSLQQFKGKFTIHKEDGYNYKDGLARIIVKEKTVCDDYNDVELSTVGTALCPSERELSAAPPAVYSGTSGMTGPSGASGMHGSYSPATVSMYTIITKTTDMSKIIVNPPINEVPYKVAMGAIAQPFLVDASITTNLNIDFYAARRIVPSWLGSFETRRLRVDLIENLLTSPVVIATGYVDAISLPQVNFDPITGLMIDPLTLADVPITTVQISGIPTLNTGIVYGISFSDDTYYPLLGTYGANAKYFVVAYGTQIVSGQSAYYYRDY